MNSSDFTLSDLKRFWTKVNTPDMDSCWEWQAGLNEHGYGMFGMWPNGSVRAHRISYCLYHGTLADNIFVLHECDNPKCINPAHLKLGTQLDNMSAASRRHRIRHGEQHKSAKLTDAQVIEIRARLAAGEGCTVISKDYGVWPACISRIRNGTRRAHPIDSGILR